MLKGRGYDSKWLVGNLIKYILKDGNNCVTSDILKVFLIRFISC